MQKSFFRYWDWRLQSYSWQLMLHTTGAQKCLYDWDMSENWNNHILKEEALPRRVCWQSPEMPGSM
ncbi:hypothetical protein DV515_00009775 [Chloebia gouldiae]|uniref:Uncharacterized protein n=1 Tax=Chloebia gouldiae TaxID=44316 RepID=A0A3L8SBW0_CHLGU|nr:hypothetical protein DV515_00009775 [Chloebia gouldiae]